MAHRIDVQFTISDARGKVKLAYFDSLGISSSLQSVSVTDSYTINTKLDANYLKKIAKVLANPVIEKAGVDVPLSPPRFDWAIEIGFLPGVTDNVGATARETVEDLLKIKFKQGQIVYTSQVYFLSGKLSLKDAVKFAQSLYNPLIQRAKIKSYKQYKKDRGMGTEVPQVVLHGKASTLSVNLNVSDEEIAKIGKLGILDKTGRRQGPLALSLAYMKVIKHYFNNLGRKPTDIELESLAQTWSEHCKHTIFANPLDEIEQGLYKGYIKRATEEVRKAKGKKDFCVSVFSDNSGAIIFDDNYLISHKVETHNTPSALDPFGGAVTGIGGVNRDCIGFGMGAKPVINVYGFCLADPRHETRLYRDKALQKPMLSSRRIMEGVVAGVNTGGNCAGIPTPQGFVFFNPRYRGKPLVFAGTVGLIPRKIKNKLAHEKQAQAGNFIVMVGGRVGQDGIHGATFSSEALDINSPATAVQIGDPITQKKMSNAIIKETRNLGLYTSITDCGAGGLSSAVAEMAKESGGCEVNLEQVPLKYSGLEPWQIWISESQERMVLAVPGGKWKTFHNLMQRRGVEATRIGKFTNSGKCVVKYAGKKIMDVDMEFLHNGLPKEKLSSKQSAVSSKPLQIAEPENLSKTLKLMLSRPNIASFEFISRQYDHEVQAGSVLKPVQGKGRVNGQATITRPILSSKRGVVLSYGYYPTYSELDPYSMAASSIDTAIRNAVSAGADPDYIALLDNFCWCSSNQPQRLWQLKQAVKACYDYAVAYGTPFISGKDSMFNDFSGYDENGNPVKISIPPTLLISAIGVIKDVGKVVSEDVKFAGDLIYILGETHEELGGSEYDNLTAQGSLVHGGIVPGVDAGKNIKMYRALHKAVQKDLIASATSVTRGGLGIALAKMSMAGNLGVDVSLGYLPGTVMRDDYLLFSESQGRILLTINPKNKTRFESLMQGNIIQAIGKVTKNNSIIRNRFNKPVVKLKVGEALKVYRSTFAGY